MPLTKFFIFAFGALALTASVRAEEEQSANVIDGTPKNFDSLISSGFTLAGFFAPWCGHCKAIKPAWNKVADLFADEPNVKIVSVNADEHKSLGQEYEVQGFPTLKFFSPSSKKPENYEKGRSVEDLVAFLNEKAGTEVAADGSGSKTAGLLPHVHDFLKGFREASKGEQETLLELASAKAGKDPESLSKWELYTKIAMKIIDQGAEYIGKEKKRLSGILAKGSSSISADKRKTFQRRINILTIFDEL